MKSNPKTPKAVEDKANDLYTNKLVKQAHQEWLSALDILEDPIFIHDKDFRILRCNRAYQQQVGIPYAQIIGRLYFDIFPKNAAPTHSCLDESENSASNTIDEEVVVGDTIFHSRAYCINDENNDYLYSVHTLEDITERLQIQRALQTSEKQYRRLFESAKDGILILDAETGVIVDANPFILRLLSYSYPEMVGMKLWEIGLFADIAESKVSFKELQTKKYIRYEDLPLKTKEGRQIEVEFVSNLYDVDQKKVIQCNIRDITERIQIQRALQTSEKQYRRLFESAKDGILILDAETGVIVDANPFILRLLSYSYPEMVGMKLWEIGLFADIAESKVSFKELQTKKYIRYEDLPLKTKEGRQIEVEFVSNLYDVDQKKVIQCNIRDITERLRSEQRLHESEGNFSSITSAAQDAIVMMDNEGKISYWNQAAEILFGYSEQEVIGEDLHTLLAPEQFLEAHRIGFEHFKKTGEGEAIGKTLELSALKKDGTEFSIELSLSAIMKEGKWNAIGIIRDISKRKKMEEELRVKDKIMMIQSRQAAMGDMIAMIAHQWRQPLSIMSMEANNLKLSLALEEEITTELLEKHIESISEQVEQLSQTIDDFRNFFKPNQAKEIVTVSDILEKTMRIIRKSMEDNNIAVLIENRSETKLETYPNQLLQVFINIINNAKDILKSKSISDAKVLITINDVEESVITSICDNGGGIPKNVMDRIGEPYFTTKKTEGTGLGLYMSKSIITEHLNGKFTWANRDGGVCFTIILPKRQNMN